MTSLSTTVSTTDFENQREIEVAARSLRPPAQDRRDSLAEFAAESVRQRCAAPGTGTFR